MTRVPEHRLSDIFDRFGFVVAIACSILIGSSVRAGQPVPNWPDATSVFGPRPLYCAGIKPTVIVDTFSAIDAASSPQRLQEISDALSEWKLEGISYAAYYSMGNIESDPNSSLYLAIWAGAQSLDLDGSPKGPLSITHQIWRDYLIDSAKIAIDVGAEYILLDVATLGLDSFDDEALAGFQGYLAAQYTASDLTAMGVADAATFDYRQFLLGQGYTTSNSVLSNAPNDSLWEAWVDHHHALERNFFVQWTSTLAAYAASRGQVVHLAVNRSTWGSGGNTQWNTADLMDITMAETFLDDLGYPFRNLSFDYKISLALGKRFWSWNEPGNTTFPANPPSTDHLGQLFTAETFANGGLNQISMVWSDFFQNGRRVDHLVPYYDFPDRHPQLFNLPEDGEIGILYSQAGETLDSGPMGRAFRSGVAILEASHRPYDVLFTGSAMPPLAASDLAAYKAVLLPDTRYLSDAEVALLEGYLSSGGTLIGTGRIGDRDETGAAATRAITTLLLDYPACSFRRPAAK